MTRSKIVEPAIFLRDSAKKSDTERKICHISHMVSMPKIPKISDEELTPLVVTLLEILQLHREQIQELRDEIAILKGQKPRPQIKPSKLENKSENYQNSPPSILRVRF